MEGIALQFDDGRETDLLRFIYGHPSIDSFRGSPSAILKAIDEYARTQKYLMNVGEDKGKIVTDLITEVRPRIMVELGGYVGYSALLFGDAVRRVGGQKYFSLERNPIFAAVIMSLADLAGLSDVVKVVVGPSEDSIRRLHADKVIQHMDMMFLDHYKPAYTADLKLCEELRLITPGSVLAADNVIYPGNPPYLEYVRSSVEEKRRKFEQNDIRNDSQDEKAGTKIKGNPKLIYESKLVESFEPSGVPVGVPATHVHDCLNC